ncbi:MAG: hypothetical protein LBK06_02095 [Planctomycetaceae bacterium]|nr:hypothetical protein [Planctomycetaceae bacterium]
MSLSHLQKISIASILENPHNSRIDISGFSAVFVLAGNRLLKSIVFIIGVR